MIEELEKRIELLEKREIEIQKELKELYKQLKKAKEAEFEIITFPPLESEFGTSMPVRFLPPSQVKMYDSDGKEVFCSCGKPAGSAIIGKHASKAMCSECMYGNESVTK